MVVVQPLVALVVVAQPLLVVVQPLVVVVDQPLLVEIQSVVNVALVEAADLVGLRDLVVLDQPLLVEIQYVVMVALVEAAELVGIRDLVVALVEAACNPLRHDLCNHMICMRAYQMGTSWKCADKQVSQQ